jgi:hypothetical protein
MYIHMHMHIHTHIYMHTYIYVIFVYTPGAGGGGREQRGAVLPSVDPTERERTESGGRGEGYRGGRAAGGATLLQTQIDLNLNVTPESGRLTKRMC